MGFRRSPVRSLAIATTIALLLSGCQATAFLRPIDPECWEWCGLDRLIAVGLITLVAFGWLLVSLLIAWRARRRAPELAALAAAAAAVVLMCLGVVWIAWWSTDAWPDWPMSVFEEIGLVLAMGIQLPAMWRLAASARPSALAALLGVVTLASTLTAMWSFVNLGADVLSDGGQLRDTLLVGLDACLVVVVAASWRRLVSERRAALVILAGAAAYVVFGVLARMQVFLPAPVGLAAEPTLAVGWAWLARVWWTAPRGAVGSD